MRRNRYGNTPEEQRKIDEFGMQLAIVYSIIIGLFKVAVIAGIVWLFWGC